MDFDTGEEERQKINAELLAAQKAEETHEFREMVEHTKTLQAVQAILFTEDGKRFFKYLFRSFEVGQLPTANDIGDEIDKSKFFARIGFLQAGNSIFKIASEADPGIAGRILASIEKERYDELRLQAQIARGKN